jgi:hypothetical protein
MADSCHLFLDRRLRRLHRSRGLLFLLQGGLLYTGTGAVTGYTVTVKSLRAPDLEEDLVEQVDDGGGEADVEPGGGELGPGPPHLANALVPHYSTYHA